MPLRIGLIVVVLALFAGCGRDSVTVETLPVHQTVETPTSGLPARWADENRVKLYAAQTWRSVAVWRYASALRFATAYDAAQRRAVHAAPQVSTPRSSSPRATGSVDAHLMSIGQCESHLNPRAVSPSGKFRGAWQFSLPTYHANGGVGDPVAASLDTQLAVARSVYATQGPGAWPVCQHR